MKRGCGNWLLKGVGHPKNMCEFFNIEALRFFHGECSNYRWMIGVRCYLGKIGQATPCRLKHVHDDKVNWALVKQGESMVKALGL